MSTQQRTQSVVGRQFSPGPVSSPWDTGKASCVMPDRIKLLIDECLHTSLVKVATSAVEIDLKSDIAEIETDEIPPQKRTTE